MPFIYAVVPGAQQTTNASGGTENDALFIKPGSTRNVFLQQMLIQGKAAALTSLSGIVARLKKWTTTASSGGTGITPTPRDVGMQASKATAGYATGGVTSGTGGPALLGAFGCSAGGPGGWAAQNADSVHTLEAADNKSIDAFVSSPTASMGYDLSAEIGE